jgi:hypothetical protein
MDELNEEMEVTIIAFPAGEVTQPPFCIIPVVPYGGYFSHMPAISNERDGGQADQLLPRKRCAWYPHGLRHDPSSLFDKIKVIFLYGVASPKTSA